MPPGSGVISTDPGSPVPDLSAFVQDDGGEGDASGERLFDRPAYPSRRR
ncbi:hypothetical protein [Roseibium sp.]